MNALVAKFTSEANIRNLERAVSLNIGGKVSYELDEDLQEAVAIAIRKYGPYEIASLENLMAMNTYVVKECSKSMYVTSERRSFWDKYRQELPHPSVQADEGGRGRYSDAKFEFNEHRRQRVPSSRDNLIRNAFFADDPTLEKLDSLRGKIGLTKDGRTQMPGISHDPEDFQYETKIEKASRSFQTNRR